VKTLYVAGPYRAPTAMGIEQNVRNAESVALRLNQLGFSAWAPHVMNRFFFGSVSEEHALPATMELQRRLDGIIMTGDWRNSTGSCLEFLDALERQQPVFFQSELTLDVGLLAWRDGAAWSSYFLHTWVLNDEHTWAAVQAKLPVLDWLRLQRALARLS
jgi:hypothetical protein